MFLIFHSWSFYSWHVKSIFRFQISFFISNRIVDFFAIRRVCFCEVFESSHFSHFHTSNFGSSHSLWLSNEMMNLWVFHCLRYANPIWTMQIQNQKTIESAKNSINFLHTVMMDEPRFAQPIPNVTVAGTKMKNEKHFPHDLSHFLNILSFCSPPLSIWLHPIVHQNLNYRIQLVVMLTCHVSLRT